MRRSIITLAFMALIWAIVSVPAAWGQAVSGTITGVVTDPSNAAVAGATVTITNVDTSIDTSRETDETGRYVNTNLSPGNYSVAVEGRWIPALRPGECDSPGGPDGPRGSRAAAGCGYRAGRRQRGAAHAQEREDGCRLVHSRGPASSASHVRKQPQQALQHGPGRDPELLPDWHRREPLGIQCHFGQRPVLREQRV